MGCRRMRMAGWCAILVAYAAWCGASAWCAGPLRPAAAADAAKTAAGETDKEPDFSDELPRIPPTEPDEAVKSFRVHPGFRIELVAAEPMIVDPVAVCFDEDGRMYAIEMIDYSEHPNDRLGRVRLLEDLDGDGRMDRSRVFAEGLSWPTALICWDGGLFVGAPPDVYYLKDTTGDGKADVQKKVFTGFGRGNVQGLMNSFRWGLDLKIYGSASTSGGKVVHVDRPELPPVELRGRDFAFDPRRMVLEATSGGGQHGMSFDDLGQRFASSNSDHIQMYLYEDRYVARNPYLAAPGPRRSIAVDGPQADVFRVSPVEPWRIVRTRLRVAGKVPGPVEGGGRPAGYFTGATGVTIYRGDAWPAEFVGNAFVGDVGSNIVHRKILKPHGIEQRAYRDRPKAEFVASTDIWFRPAQFANAPDGCLYICDVYREVIEHPASLPPIIKKHLDTDSGNDRGRVWRVVAENHRQRPLPKMSQASSAELVALLEHRNGWHRDTAARLLYQRQDRSVVAALERLVGEAPLPQAKVHALYVLGGLESLSPQVVLAALGDAHPRVREHAIRAAEPWLAQWPQVQQQLFAMTGDDDPRVRYQLAFTLGEVEGPRRDAALAELARRDAQQFLTRLAVQSSLATGADNVLAALAADKEFRGTAAGAEWLESLAQLIGRRASKPEVAAVLRLVAQLQEEPDLRRRVLQGLTAGINKSGSALRQALENLGGGQAAALLDEMLAEARQTAVDANQPLEARVQAMGLLALAPWTQARDILSAALEPAQPYPLQRAALSAMARQREAAVAELVLKRWSGLSPQLRAAASELLFAGPERIALLLTALEEGRLAPTELDPARLKLLREHADPALRRRAEKLLGGLKLARRADVVESYRGVLEMSGNAARGKQLFAKHCAACHKLEDVGHEIGPSLAAMRNRGAEAILLNVLDPNREVNPQYVNYLAVLADGRSVTGMIAAETATSVTLVRGEKQQDVILRGDLEELRSTGLSLMPENMEKQLDHQAMADLIAYLMALKP